MSTCTEVTLSEQFLILEAEPKSVKFQLGILDNEGGAGCGKIIFALSPYLLSCSSKEMSEDTVPISSELKIQTFVPSFSFQSL